MKHQSERTKERMKERKKTSLNQRMLAAPGRFAMHHVGTNKLELELEQNPSLVKAVFIIRFFSAGMKEVIFGMNVERKKM